MHGTRGMKVLKQRREEMLREPERNRLKKALRAKRKRPAAPRWASTVVQHAGVPRQRAAQVLSDAQERRLGSADAAAWANRGTLIR